MTVRCRFGLHDWERTVRNESPNWAEFDPRPARRCRRCGRFETGHFRVTRLLVALAVVALVEMVRRLSADERIGDLEARIHDLEGWQNGSTQARIDSVYGWRDYDTLTGANL